MALSQRFRSLVFGSFITVTCFIASSLVIHAAAPADPARVTAVANVTVRATPSPTAPALAQLPLGTEVYESGPAGLDKTWVLVRFGDSREGWVQSKLTRPLDPVWRWPVFDRIINERLGRKGDGFAANVELVSFIERVAPEYTDKDGRARVELARLRALSLAAASVPLNRSAREPYASWLAARKDDLVYDEPGGRWMVRDTAIWNVHATQAQTAAADDIAWFAVTTGLSGECEGRIVCYFAARNRLQGSYLRRHPAGRHAVEAVGAVNQLLASLASSTKVSRSYHFDAKSDCAELTASVDGLSAAIQEGKAEGWDSTVANLANVRKLCQ
jgi:hypothetical protein